MHYSWSRYVKVVNEDGASVSTKVGGETALLHAYHSDAQTVVPIRRSSGTDEVTQGRQM
jgi:hypothetical protein